LLEESKSLLSASVVVSIYEVYNNNIHDLLSDDQTVAHKVIFGCCQELQRYCF
jgi:hypothetical protein